MNRDKIWIKALESRKLLRQNSKLFVWPAPYGDPRVAALAESPKVEKVFFANGGEGLQRQEKMEDSHRKFRSLDLMTGKDVFNYDAAKLDINFDVEIARDPAMAVHHNPEFIDAVTQKDASKADKVFRKIIEDCVKASLQITAGGATIYDTDHFGHSPSMSNPKFEDRAEHLQYIGEKLSEHFSTVEDFEPDNHQPFFLGYN